LQFDPISPPEQWRRAENTRVFIANNDLSFLPRCGAVTLRILFAIATSLKVNAFDIVVGTTWNWKTKFETFRFS
jgi:hypothetical protein